MSTIFIILLFFSASGSICVSAGDMPKEFVVAGSDVYQGKNYQTFQASIADLQGVWHFGESESEWSVAIIPYEGGFIVQTSSVFYSEKMQNFLSVYSTMNKMKIENGVFRIAKPHSESGHYAATFIESKGVNPKIGKKDVMILLDGDSLISGKDAILEAGVFHTTLEKWFGDHHPLSCTILDEEYLKTRSAAELALMRNEIYAYYGMVFKSDELTNHYSKMAWYRPWRKNVDECISQLEWKNIELIKKWERKADL